MYSVAVPRASAGAGAGSGAAFAGEQGKEGVFIAETVPGAVHAEQLEALQHRAEVQHLALHEDGSGTAVLASVDCYGRAVLAHMRRLQGGSSGEGGESGGGGSDPGGLHIAGVQQLQPTDLLRCAGQQRAGLVGKGARCMEWPGCIMEDIHTCVPCPGPSIYQECRAVPGLCCT